MGVGTAKGFSLSQEDLDVGYYWDGETIKIGTRNASLAELPSHRPSRNNRKSNLSKTTSHFELRSSEVRSTSQAYSDLQNAKDSDIFVQDDGRFVIRGAKAREHIISDKGELITTANNWSKKAHLSKLGDESFPASKEEIEKVRSFLGDD